MKAKTIFSLFNKLHETELSPEEFNQQARELFVDVSTYFKQQLVTNLASFKFITSNDESKLNRRVEYKIFYPDFSLLSQKEQLGVFQTYTKSFCKHFKSSPIKAINHIFEDGTTIIYIASKHRHLDFIFDIYLKIEMDNFLLPDKDSFHLVVRFGDYLSHTVNTHSFFKSIEIRDKQRLSTREKMNLFELFVLEIKRSIYLTAKAVRLTEV